jgi:hypothetical protein
VAAPHVDTALVEHSNHNFGTACVVPGSSCLCRTLVNQLDIPEYLESVELVRNALQIQYLVVKNGKSTCR